MNFNKEIYKELDKLKSYVLTEKQIKRINNIKI